MKSDRASSPRSSAAGRPDRARGNGATDAPSTPSAAVATRSLAPYYHDDLVAVYHADATDLSFLAEQSVHLVVTSPPYNLGKDYGSARDNATYHEYLDWAEGWCRELYRVLEPGGRLCLNVP